MFVRMLTVHCDQNDSYEVITNGYQVRKDKRSKKHHFRYPLLEIFLSIKVEAH